MAATLGLSQFDEHALISAVSTRVVSTVNTKAGAIYMAPKTGNISAIGFSCSALSGSPTVDVRLESVSAQMPSGTLFATNTNVAYSPVSTNTFVWSTLTAAAAVTAGDKLAAVVGYTSGTSATVVFSATSGPLFQLPTAVVMSAGSWAWAGPTPTICLKYDDGTIVRGGYPISQFTSSNIQSGTTPNERAGVFTAPADGTIIGLKFYANFTSSSAAATANLYEGTGTSPMSGATQAIAAGLAQNGQGIYYVDFPAPIVVVAGGVYRPSVKATAAVNITLYRLLFPSTAERDCVFGELRSDTRKDAAWIGETTTTSEMILPRWGSVTGGATRNKLQPVLVTRF